MPEEGFTRLYPVRLLSCLARAIEEPSGEDPATTHALIVYLLSVGADPRGELVMETALSSGSVEALRLVIDAGGDVNSPVSGLPPLLWLLSRGLLWKSSKVEMLLAEPSVHLDEAMLEAAPHSSRDIFQQEVRPLLSWSRCWLFGCGVPGAVNMLT